MAPRKRTPPTEVVDDPVDGDASRCDGATVLDLDDAVGQAAAHDHDGGHPHELGVLDFTPWADLAPVVVDHRDAGLVVELAGGAARRG